MQVFCPQCATSNEVPPSSSAATCSQCGASLPVHVPVYGPPDAAGRPQAFGVEEMAAVPRVVPPKINFVWNEQQLAGGVWGVFVGGRNAAGILWVLLALAAIGLAALALATGDAMGGPIALGGVGVFLAYRALCWAVNRGTVRVDQNWLLMARGPVPQWGSARVPLAAIAALRPVKTGAFRSGSTVTKFFGVQAIGGDGTLWRLPFPGMPLERASFICERLNMMVRDVQKRSGILAPPLPMLGPQGQMGQF